MLYRCLALFALTVLFALPSYAHHLAVIVPKDNHTDSLTSAELGKILKAEMKKWRNGNDVVVVITRNSPLTMQVVERLGHMSESAAKNFVAAHKDCFIVADSDAALLKIVETTPGALGIVDVHAIHDTQVRVLRVDGRLPLERDYLPH
jgi:ABC-type phosphate transport system substrate-binding protein